MFETVSIKDIIAINNKFDNGKIINAGSLSFALERANKSGSWLRACAYIVRAILIDHVFEEGNKRTTAGVIVAFFEEHELQYHPEDVARAITKILMKNMTSITQIERVIKNAII